MAVSITVDWDGSLGVLGMGECNTESGTVAIGACIIRTYMYMYVYAMCVNIYGMHQFTSEQTTEIESKHK